ADASTPYSTHTSLMWVSLHGGTTSLGKGRISLETVTSEGCHRHTDLCRLPVAMPGDRQRQRMRKLSRHGSTLPVSLYIPLAGSGGSALYVFRDRCCANRQRDLVVYERKLMGENVLSDLGIQQALTGNEGIYGTQEHAHVFSAQL